MLNRHSEDERLRRAKAIAALHEVSDPVEQWKRVALAHSADEQRARARRGPIRVTISLPFVVLAMLVGLPFGLAGPPAMLLLLSSVLLLHEFPRALVARAAGRASRITLSLYGADTETVGLPLSGPARIAFPVVGSIANALAAALVIALMRTGVVAGHSPILETLWISQAAWAMAQVLPIAPFQLGRALARCLRPPARLTHAALSVLFLSLALPLVGRANTSTLFPLFALAVTACGAALFRAYRENSDALSGAPALARQAAQLLSDGDCARGAEVVEQALAIAQAEAQRRELWRQLAWCAIGKQDPFLAHKAVQELPSSMIDLHLVASYLACCNRNPEAVKLLGQARALGHRARETTKLLIDLLFGAGERTAALDLARADAALLSTDDQKTLESVLPRESA